jgi:hypothetical protein
MTLTMIPYTSTDEASMAAIRGINLDILRECLNDLDRDYDHAMDDGDTQAAWIVDQNIDMISGIYQDLLLGGHLPTKHTVIYLYTEEDFD